MPGQIVTVTKPDFRDGDETQRAHQVKSQKVLPAHLGQGWNAGAAKGSFSASRGLLFRRPKTEASFAVKSAHSLAGADTKTVGGGGEIRRGGKRTLCLVHLARPNRDSDEMACQGKP